MARVNVYVPDDLVERARQAGLNVSSITQEAIRLELAGQRTSEWLDIVRALPRTGVAHDEAIEALDQLRAEAGDDWPAASGRRGAQSDR